MVHLTLLLLVLCAGVTASSVVDLQKRIIGGQQCGQNERLYHVKLKMVAPNGASSFCGGSLISNRWILTAAHCWEPGERMFAIVGVHPGPRRQPVEITERQVYIDGNGRPHDIMLLKLPRPETEIQPIALPDCSRQPQLGQTVQIAGHGATRHGPRRERLQDESPTLQCANIEVVNCQSASPIQITYSPYRLDRHVFCGQNRQGSPQVDACKGDSGGGVIFNNNIYGVISSGGPLACTSPVKFMNVCHPDYFRWIRNTIRPRTKCLNCFRP